MIKIVALFILIIGLAAGLYLVQHPTIFKPKADEPKTILKTEKGFQIDTSNPEKVPSQKKFNTLRPKWARFVYHSKNGIPQEIPANVKILLVFNNEVSQDLEDSLPPLKAFDPNPDVWKDFTEIDVNAWKNYADQKYLPALEDFLKSGQRVDALQIFNEPDSCGTTTSHCLPAAAYAYILKKSAEKIKGFNQNIKVITAGFSTQYWDYIKALKQSDPGVFAQVDAIGVHPYGLYPDDTSSPSGWCKGKVDETGKPTHEPYDKTDPEYAECGENILPNGGLGWVINEYKTLSGLPAWVTEVGIDVNDEVRDNEVWQTKYLDKIFKVFNENDVKVAIWYGWTDKMSGGNGEKKLGLVDDYGTIKGVGMQFREQGEY